ncbi:DUF2993 domain-containing protein [Cryobacterium psychrophilum]|uniref:DUF2993 domain-containing protein n=1 Tax=Cryobacterium psychrophilum TaxID=41988 RepID=A0A4Y8KLA3_9MICO|nr:DUF2993 domain-containing protein [Cryobacterium psychrophilum]TDW29182.1 hypothetical protein EDD25_0867 [Cryobacterium psychrophilum]TFD77841.1 DUF2993 domain-containing protein [Cryobacterium psychrophilum]
MAGKRRGPGRLIMLVVMVGLLVSAFFLVDFGLRAFAEGQAESQIRDALPASATGDVNVSIGGVSVITQYVTGSFDEVELTAPRLTVDGVPASIRVVAADVQPKLGGSIGHVVATIDLTPEALNNLAHAAGTPPETELVLGTDEVTYTGNLDVLGITTGYLATATPSTTPDSLLFTPTGAQVTTELGTLDLSGIVATVLGQTPIRICVAKYLPAEVAVRSADVTPERARITLDSSTLVLTTQSLATLGTCPG